MTRDMQTTNRYEHSLDSAMRPVSGHCWFTQLVQPGRDLTTDSRAPLRLRAPWQEPLAENSVPELRTAATRTSRPLRVSVKNLE